MRISHKPADFTPAPEGRHNAVCCDVVDLGLVTGQYGEKHQCRIYWQIDEINEDAKPPKRFVVSKQYNVSLDPKSTLRKNLEAWRGRGFTKEELADFDTENLVGAPCEVVVQHNIKDEGTYANVVSLVCLRKGDTPLKLDGSYTRKKDRDDYQAPRSAAPAAEEAAAASSGYDDDVPF